VSHLSIREGYRRWAPLYARETAISFLETQLVEAVTPPMAGRRLLDAGCGTGRRLVGCGAALAVGVDVSPEMLEAGVGIGASPAHPHLRTLVGDIRCLPLADGGFDIVWCRLAIGHLPECEKTYAELARVAAPGATVIVTDFHEAAHRAGHRRSFRDDEGVHEIEHYIHDARRQHEAARAAGLELFAQSEAVIGPQVLPFYEQAGRPQLYREHEGLPVVLLLAFRKGEA
jgi:malonyl-CoA O-methyltransferase